MSTEARDTGSTHYCFGQNKEQSRGKESVSILCRVRSFQAPSDDLIEALTVLVRYLTTIEPGQNSPSRPAQTLYWLPTIPADAGGQQQVCGNMVMPRPWIIL